MKRKSDSQNEKSSHWRNFDKAELKDTNIMKIIKLSDMQVIVRGKQCTVSLIHFSGITKVYIFKFKLYSRNCHLSRVINNININIYLIIIRIKHKD